ncbi:MAG: PAS domain-containing protein, partial [Bacteroidota bacterium]
SDRTKQHESLFWSELQKGKTQQGLYPFRNLKDDKDYWMSGVYSPIYDENGEIQKVYQVMRDMTRERQKNQNYERQIRAFNRFNSIVELNDKGDIIQANANFASLLGFSFIELRDKRYTELFVKEEDRNEFKDYLKAALDGQITQTVHLHTRKDDTPIWIELFYLPLRDYRTKTRSLMLILTDITVRKEYEAKLHKLRNETLATNKQLAEKNDILETATTILDQKNKEIKLQHEEYVKQSQLLEIQNQRVSDSIQYASRIQQSIMTRKEVVESAFEDAFIMLLPRERVSGDFYYFVEVGDRLILVAADCTGHGVPGAFMSLIGHNLLDQMVKMMGLTSPEMMLSGLHMGVQKNLRQKETQNRDGMDIAICCWDRGQQVLEFAGAKNPIFYIQDGEAHLLKGDRTPIGGIQKEKRRMFTKHKIDLKDKETTFYLFSDGFQDQFGGENDRKFGGKRFRALLESIHTLPMKEQQEILLQTHDNWRGDGSQLDDILVTGIKISG